MATTGIWREHQKMEAHILSLCLSKQNKATNKSPLSRSFKREKRKEGMGDLNQVKEEKIKNLEGETTPNKKNNMN